MAPLQRGGVYIILICTRTPNVSLAFLCVFKMLVQMHLFCRCLLDGCQSNSRGECTEVLQSCYNVSICIPEMKTYM